MKSPLLRAFFTPHVHPRPRKRPPRCTLDCGFKTPESPALRGFVAERGPIRGTSLYLVLKSNGLPRPKIRLKKFGFSLTTTSANIAKKLPPQRCSQPFLIAFSTSRTNGPRSLSRVKAGTHSAFGERLHTTAYTPKQEHSLPRPQCGFALPVNSFLFRHAFIYIHFPVHCEPPLSAERKIRRNCRHKFYPQPFLIPVFNFSHKRPTFAFTPESGYTHSAFGERSHTSAYTPKQGVFQMGCYYYPRTVSHVSETLRGQGGERQTVPLLGLGRGRSRRTQRACGTAMRLCASLSRRRRGPAGLRDLFATW